MIGFAVLAEADPFRELRHTSDNVGACLYRRPPQRLASRAPATRSRRCLSRVYLGRSQWPSRTGHPFDQHRTRFPLPGCCGSASPKSKNEVADAGVTLGGARACRAISARCRRVDSSQRCKRDATARTRDSPQRLRRCRGQQWPAELGIAVQRVPRWRSAWTMLLTAPTLPFFDFRSNGTSVDAQRCCSDGA